MLWKGTIFTANIISFTKYSTGKISETVVSSERGYKLLHAMPSHTYRTLLASVKSLIPYIPSSPKSIKLPSSPYPYKTFSCRRNTKWMPTQAVAPTIIKTQPFTP